MSLHEYLTALWTAALLWVLITNIRFVLNWLLGPWINTVVWSVLRHAPDEAVTLDELHRAVYAGTRGMVGLRGPWAREALRAMVDIGVLAYIQPYRQPHLFALTPPARLVAQLRGRPVAQEIAPPGMVYVLRDVERDCYLSGNTTSPDPQCADTWQRQEDALEARAGHYVQEARRARSGIQCHPHVELVLVPE